MSRQFNSRQFGLIAALTAAIIALPAWPAAARGPENISDVAEQVIDAVVNVSTSQKVDSRISGMPDLPPGSPMEQFFEDFFKKHRGQGGPDGQGGSDGQGDNSDADKSPRRVNSLGSGFIIDPSGLIVTNNHVIADADEINVIFNDGTKLPAQLVGKDSKADLALLRVKADHPLKAVAFGDSDKLRLGEWVIAIGNPFSLGGTVTAGIVSARNRDIQSGPYDNYIQTDAAINRGNSGGPLFNLNGEVIGINTAIISPSGGSIGIGFAVPSDTAVPVLNQLREYGEARRGWLGVRIQQVTDDIAESLSIKPPHGALVAGVDDKGPAKPGGIEPGDVVVKFDGHDIKEMRDLRHRHPQGQGRDPSGQDRPARRYPEGGVERSEAGYAAGTEVDRAENARARAFQHVRRPAQEVQDPRQRQRRCHHRGGFERRSFATRQAAVAGRRHRRGAIRGCR
jgi:serine protease Do